MAVPAASARSGDEAVAALHTLRAQDMRLYAIGYRLATANAPVCPELQPATGMQLQTIDQYPAKLRGAVRTAFALATRVGVEGVVAGSPAALAGVKADDSIARIAARDTADPAAATGAGGSTDYLIDLYRFMAALAPSKPIAMEILRRGERTPVTLQPVASCPSRFEVKEASGLYAVSDGEMVQVGTGLINRLDDDLLAATVAHELAHNILRHRKRLDERGVSWGLFKEFGSNVGYFRQVELEADTLSVSLLANAGYDPFVAVRFWEKVGPDSPSGLSRSRTYPPWRDRMAAIRREAERIATIRERPIRSPLLDRRYQKLDGNWRALLAPSQ